MTKSVPVRVRETPQNTDLSNLENEILLALPRKECNAIFAKLELVRLQGHQVLHEAGDKLKSGYFCNSGMFSLLTVMPDGTSVEVGLIGKEGFAGLPLIAGFTTTYTRTVVQGEGTAYRVDADSLRDALRECPQLERQLQRSAQLLTMQVSHIATCNRLHEIGERLARWLLMTQDRLGSALLPLTQELIAEMLGTRRSSVTVAAGILQKAGLISYKRGHVNILDREGLEEAACDCYGVLQQHTKEWQQQNV